MIGKFMNGTNFRGCFEYCLNEKKKPEILKMNGTYGLTPDELDKQFRAISNLRPNVRKKVWHMTISFGHSDKVTANLIDKVCQEYLHKMGLTEHQYVIVKHNDTKHEHLHIVANRIGVDGQPLKDWNTARKTKGIMEELEKKFKLTVAKDQHNIRKKEIEMTILKGIQDKQGIDSIMRRVEALGYKVIYNKSSQGKVRGVSFVHKKKGINFKLSDISRKLTYARLLHITRGFDDNGDIIDSRDNDLKK